MPPICYATAEDGTRIGYWTLGQGEPLLYIGAPCFSHAGHELELPHFVRWYSRLAEGRMLVRLDLRGYGASQRDLHTLTAEALVSDVLAVTRDLGLSSFSLVVQGGSTDVGVRLALETSLVNRLVIIDGWTKGREFPVLQRILAARALATVDWKMHSEFMARVVLGARDHDASQVASFLRASSTLEGWTAYTQLFAELDVSDRLPSLRLPCLVLNCGESRLTGQGEASRELADRIPGAMLATFDAPNFPVSEIESIFRTVSGFLGTGTVPVVVSPRLSAREWEVLALVGRGHSNREIAAALVISPATVARHVHNILNKLSVKRRGQAAAWYLATSQGPGIHRNM